MGGSKAKHSRAGPSQEPPLGFSGPLHREEAADNVWEEEHLWTFLGQLKAHQKATVASANPTEERDPGHTHH